jgi:hypothetical protein
MTAAIRERVVEQVKQEWASDPNVSAREIARRFLRKHGADFVKERTIVSIVSRAKEEAPDEPFPIAPWKPWVSTEESPEQTFYLLRLHHLKWAKQGKELYAHEAKWALRLQRALLGLELHQQYEIIMRYAGQEEISYYLNAPPTVDDLDAFVSYAMWLSPQHQQRYEDAIAAGVAPVPFLGSVESLLPALNDAYPSNTPAAQLANRDPAWALLMENPIFKLILAGGTRTPGWSSILLEYLGDPQSLGPLVSIPTTGNLTPHSGMVLIKSPAKVEHQWPGKSRPVVQ